MNPIISLALKANAVMSKMKRSPSRSRSIGVHIMLKTVPHKRLKTIRPPTLKFPKIQGFQGGFLGFQTLYKVFRKPFSRFSMFFKTNMYICSAKTC